MGVTYTSAIVPFLVGDPRPHLTHGSFSRLRPHPKPNFDSCNHNDRPQPLLWRSLQTAQYDCDCMSRLGSSHWSCCTERIAVLYSLSTFVFSALTLLVWRQEEHPACKNWWGAGVVICLEWGADCLHMVQLMPLSSQTPSSLASFKSRLVLPFWYWLTQVVLERGRSTGVVFTQQFISSLKLI